MSKFANVAIKCDTFEQIEHLAELARKEGLDVRNIIAAGCWYFSSDFFGEYYTNWMFAETRQIISYSDFIAEYSPQPTYTHDEYMRNVVHSMD